MATPKLESNGKTWGITANYTNVAGVKQRKYKGGFSSPAKAQKWAASYIAEMKRLAVVDQNMTIREIVAQLLYEKEHVDEIEADSLAFYEHSFGPIIDQIGDLKPNQITVLTLQKLVTSDLEHRRKCKAICQCLSTLYTYMERADLVERNLYKKINPPAYTPKETAFYDLDHYKKLLELVRKDDSPIYTPVLIMGSLGLRPSEALALDETDLKNNILYITKAFVRVKRKGQKSEYVIKTVKTKKSRRAFPLDEEFVEEIRRYKKEHNIDCPYLCALPDGRRMTEHQLGRKLKFIVEKYELDPISPYGLRHTFGHIQKNNKTDIYTISRLMGHSNIHTTTSTYFHDDQILNADAIKSVADNILAAHPKIKCK